MPKGVKRNYAAERARRNERARANGFTSQDAQSKYLRERGLRLQGGQVPQGPARGETAALASMGVSRRQFEAMREANRNYAFDSKGLMDKNPRSAKTQRNQRMALFANNYDYDRDPDVKTPSADQVEYVVTFYRAVVDPKTNRDSLMRDGERWIRTSGKLKSNVWQKRYLTSAARWPGSDRALMTVEDYDQRYSM